MSDLVILKNEAQALGGGLNGFREAIQRHILRSMAGAGFFQDVAFIGGTALRIGHQLNRFSEDLDFAVLQPLPRERLIQLGDTVFNVLKKLKISVSASRDFRTIPMGGTVSKLDFIYYIEVKLPASFRQGTSTFTLRLDVDRNPANGWQVESSLLKSPTRPFALIMHDLPSLFAGKLHVLCCRSDRVKGRDFFDLAWYLSHKVTPNLAFLQGTIDSIESKPWSADQWSNRLIQRLKTMDFNQLKRDLSPFLMDQNDLMLMDSDLLIGELEKDL